MTQALTLVGRSSSHFTRVARLYAAELGVPHDFSPVLALASTQSATFADNPALRVPSLRTPEGTWFGSLNICRELARRSPIEATLVWPEDLLRPLTANAQELTLEGMAAEVTVVMGRLAGLTDEHPALEKPFARARGCARWLDANLDRALACLPERRLSFLEVTAYCFATHLEFRQLLSLAELPRLHAFTTAFGARPAAQATAYGFDQPPASPS
ncbi:MAG TPA: glutathione S-transferase family protein [Polyangiaceae bacterium]|jgi:glutathione S-transferase|nr:glutathione S-transferase family protein [Polyangiaceae bacterium]